MLCITAHDRSRYRAAGRAPGYCLLDGRTINSALSPRDAGQQGAVWYSPPAHITRGGTDARRTESSLMNQEIGLLIKARTMGPPLFFIGTGSSIEIRAASTCATVKKKTSAVRVRGAGKGRGTLEAPGHVSGKRRRWRVSDVQDNNGAIASSKKLNKRGILGILRRCET